MLIFKISQLNYAYILVSMQYRKCEGICIKDAVICFSCVLWTIHSQTVHI